MQVCAAPAASVAAETWDVDATTAATAAAAIRNACDV
jgi:hypothetical protein